MISIVGGSGFIGTRLSYHLNKQNLGFTIVDKVLSADFPENTYIADVRSIESLEKAISENSILVNLAAEHRDDVSPISLYDEVNVQGARNLCLVAIKKNIKTIIFTSSVAVYGFAQIGTDESGIISPFNAYGSTKYEAELIFKAWQAEDPLNRVLVIIRPTVVFGERNRGNVYNLLSQIAVGKFIMIGGGLNRKSMAYVGNVISFIAYSLTFKPGVHIYNYVDKPDFTMNELVSRINKLLGRRDKIYFRLPYWIGLCIGMCCDFASKITSKKLPVSSIRVKKFCANSVYGSAINESGFIPPTHLTEAIEQTIKFEFIENNQDKKVFFTE